MLKIIVIIRPNNNATSKLDFNKLGNVRAIPTQTTNIMINFLRTDLISFSLNFSWYFFPIIPRMIIIENQMICFKYILSTLWKANNRPKSNMTATKPFIAFLVMPKSNSFDE